MKRILLLGSTGSIGVNTCSVVRELKDEFCIVGMSTNVNIETLLKQTVEFAPISVYIESKNAKCAFIKENMDSKIKIFDASDGLAKFVSDTDFDILVNALTGYAGFLPTLAAIKKNKTIALANKETLVVGGDIITSLAKKHGVSIIPIDSEHSAIFQILTHFCKNELMTQNITAGSTVEKIILTASGGSLYNVPKAKFPYITVQEALSHPTWSMGKKITIDSATMLNKGFEVIEAHHLFNIDYDKIEVIIHPQSIVHSLVEFIDGEIYAQLGVADMRIPIQNALTYPNIKHTAFGKLNLAKCNNLNFFEVDFEKFPLLKLAYECGRIGGILPCVLNAANEICVYAFLSEEISFSDIYRVIAKMCEGDYGILSDIENIIEVDRLVREKTTSYIRKNIKMA